MDGGGFNPAHDDEDGTVEGYIIEENQEMPPRGDAFVFPQASRPDVAAAAAAAGVRRPLSAPSGASSTGWLTAPDGGTETDLPYAHRQSPPTPASNNPYARQYAGSPVAQWDGTPEIQQ